MKDKALRLEYRTLKGLYKKYSRLLYSKELNELHANQLQTVIGSVIKDEIIGTNFETAQSYLSSKRVAIYFSMEFLIGRIVIDALNNIGIKEMTKKIFEDEGIDINILEEVEDTALGNGGLGRLAACFIESAATTGYPVYGYGLYYKYGLFMQKFSEDNEQLELPDYWADSSKPWFEPDEEEAVVVSFKGAKVKAVPYVMPVIGYNSNAESFNQNVFPLTLWKSEIIRGETTINVKRISDNLYPDDSTEEGKKLRICQEYFFVSATMQKLIKNHLEKFGTLDNFEEYYVFQMNDTHPVLAAIEYIRLLKEHGYSFEEASAKAKKCFAYTNHTVLSEALERWDARVFEDVIPECYKIIQELNQELIDTYLGMPFFKLPNGQVDWQKINKYELIYHGQVHMSKIACYIGFSVNGVAAIHSQIIRDYVLNEWYQVYPDTFTNCTNGVTPRRWILNSNEALAKFLDDWIGTDWITNLTELEKLDAYKDDYAVLTEFADCKKKAKAILADEILKKEGVQIDPDSIFVCQVKRIHEYKRQLMNAFRILCLYDGIKNGSISDFYNTTFIIGGKAAASYTVAKRIIKLLKDIQDLVNNDPDMAGKMKVVFVTNFNVSYGEKIYAAADFSEQISTAGKEASGTGNMKFMMNGAPTIGTMDGANIEIVEEAGIENNYIFGATVDEINEMKYTHSYNPAYFMDSSPEMRVVKSYLTHGRLKNNYQDVLNLLRGKDEYFTMYDLASYIQTTLQAISDYAHEKRTGDYSFYTKKSFANVAHSGKFSSDRTIREYATKIWHIEPIKP